MSFFRAIYDQHAVPAIMSTFCDDNVEMLYTIGSTVTELRGIDRGETIELEVDVEGDEIKRHRKQVVISTSSCSPWGGVRDPQITATITIDGTRWAIEPKNGQAVESCTDSFAVINLVRSSGVAKAYPNYRKE